MGERCNVVFAAGKAITPNTNLDKLLDGNIVLYSHWGGSSIATDLREALRAAQPRWGDDSYGTRIVVSQIVGKSWPSETGYGLSVGQLVDNEHNFLVVDWLTQNVLSTCPTTGRRVGCVGFATYLGMDDEACRLFHEPDRDSE